MSKEKEINILLADRCSRIEAERYLSKASNTGVIIYESEAECRENGDFENANKVEYDGHIYFVVYID